MLAAPYLGSLPVRTIPAVVALTSQPELTADQVPSVELTALLGSHANDLTWVLALLITAGLLSFGLALLNTRVGARFSSTCARDLRSRLHDVLLTRPPAYLREQGRGNHTRNALINQSRVVASYAANTLPASVGILFAVIIWAQTLFTAVADTASGPVAAGIVGGVVALLVAINLLTVWLSGKKSQASQRDVMKRQAEFIGLIGESVEHVEALQLDLAERAQQRRLERILLEMSAAEIRVATWSGLASAASSGVVLLGIPLLVLGWQAMDLPGAQLAVMIPALMMLQRSIASIGSVWTSRHVSMPSIELVADLLADDPNIHALPRTANDTRPDTNRQPTSATDDVCDNGTRGHLAFRDVHWSAPEPGGDSRVVLAGIDLDVEPGETLALVGAGGCGKSTLLRLLLRIVSPDAGTISLDGTDIANLPLADVRRRVGLLAQHPAFFSRSVRDNLVLDDRDIDDAAIHRAAGLTQFDEMLDRLADGLDHRLPPGGGALSGSEKRRLALTRLLLRQPDIILIDELEAGLPQSQAQQILSAVREATKGTTCVMVTHRPDLLKADRVAFVHKGCIVDIGSHDELQERRSAYRDLLARRREDAP